MIEFGNWLKNLPTGAIVIGFALSFPVFWCLILKVLAKKSGWSRLAVEFGFAGDHSGKLHRFQSAVMNKVSFGNSLNIGVDRAGLYLVPVLIFRLFFKPLLIPWDKINASPKKKWGFDGCELSFPRVPDVSVRFYGRPFERIKGALTAQVDLNSGA